MRFFLFTAFIFPILGLSSFEIKNAALAQMNDSSFAFVSDVLKKKVLKNVSSYRFDDVEQDVGKGVKVRVKDIRLWLDFEDLKITSTKSGIQIDVGIKNGTIEIGKMEFEKKIIKPITVTCVDTKILFAHHNGIPISSLIGLGAYSQEIKAWTKHVNFSLNSHEYEPGEPRHCSGGFTVRDFIEEVIQTVLEESREDLEEVVRENISNLTPELESYLNTAFNQSISVNLISLGVKKYLKLSAKPSLISHLNNSLKIGFDLNLEKTNEKGSSLFQNKIGLPNNIKVSTATINELLKFIYSNEDYLEITPSIIPNINEILLKKNMSVIWPDLASRHLDENYLKAFVKLNDLQIKISEDSSSINLVAPSIEVMMRIYQKGEWLDYFKINNSLELDFKHLFQNNKSLISLNMHDCQIKSFQWMRKSSIELFQKNLVLSQIRKNLDRVVKKSYMDALTYPKYVLDNWSFDVSAVKLSEADVEVDFLISQKDN